MFYRTDTDDAVLIVYDSWDDVRELSGSLALQLVNEGQGRALHWLCASSPEGREIFRLRKALAAALVQPVRESPGRSTNEATLPDEPSRRMP
jgi:hypothetical protein